SISEDRSNIPDKDLRSIPKLESLVCAVGKQSRWLLQRCIKGLQNHSADARGYIKDDGIEVAINIPELTASGQSKHEIVELFEIFMKEVNSSFLPDGHDEWKVHIPDLKIAFEKLLTGLETILADMKEGTQMDQTIRRDNDISDGLLDTFQNLGITIPILHSVGFKRSAFNDELRKLDPLIDSVLETSSFVANYRMYFPFLAEVKCGAAALDVTNRQNVHSMTVAVRALAGLFRSVKREKELDRKTLASFISHDHRSVRIYGH
ncbi:MAG: hypothetical protein Q9191_008483, partial [Dirinaria sp. TL-2023a]